MKYEEFKVEYISGVKQYFDEKDIDVDIEIINKCKVNIDNDAIVIKEKGSLIGQTIDLIQEYEKWMLKDISVREYVISRVKLFEQELGMTPEIPELSFENMKDNIIYDAINAVENRRLLENVPYRQIGDIAIIPRWKISDKMTAIISTSLCKYIGEKPEDILDLAYKNTLNSEFVIHSLGSEDMDVSLYVITNRDREYGAAAIALPEIMCQLREVIDGEAYIIPSSRNELIALQKRDDIDGRMLEMMIREVNATSLSREEFLSNSLYEYNLNTNRVKLADTEKRGLHRGRSR